MENNEVLVGRLGDTNTYALHIDLQEQPHVFYEADEIVVEGTKYLLLESCEFSDDRELAVVKEVEYGWQFVMWTTDNLDATLKQELLKG